MKFILAVVALAIVDFTTAGPGVTKTTDQRIAEYNYPVETHVVESPDGYVLTMFRIPFSRRLENENEPRPVAFLQHGLLSSSDSWIINGPENALAYLLVDAGYDVWLGNARGNTYSKKHVRIPSFLPKFWDFSWHEIAVYDMPTMIDYVLDNTNETALHYVGHSQGTTVFFILMSLMPEYNDKIKTAHMLAPIAFMSHLKSPLIQVLSPVVGQPSVLNELIGDTELVPSNRLLTLLGSRTCAETSKYQPICTNGLFLLVGFNVEQFNETLFPDIVQTHPAGSSTKQGIHYIQEVKSGFFRQYDHKAIKNFLEYGQSTPPNYPVEVITAPVRLYFSGNDWLSAVMDVVKLEGLLQNVVDSYLVPNAKWNHLDYLWALDVKELIYDRIIAATEYYEQTGEQ